MTILGFADGDIGGRQVAYDRSAGHRRKTRRRNGHPDIFADFNEYIEILYIGGFKNQICAERNIVLACQGYVFRKRLFGGRELSGLVVFAIIRQIGFDGNAENAASVENHRAVKKTAINPQRRANRQNQI